MVISGYLNLSTALHTADWPCSFLWLGFLAFMEKKMHGSQSFNCFVCFYFVNEVQLLPLTSEETLGIKQWKDYIGNSQRSQALFPCCRECISPWWQYSLNPKARSGISLFPIIKIWCYFWLLFFKLCGWRILTYSLVQDKLNNV